MPAPEPVRQSDGWMSRGACRGEDPELFFPVTETNTAAGRQIAAAKAVCGRCLVWVTCLAFAMATGQDGVWGGTTGYERRAWRFASREEQPGLRATAPTAPGQAASTRAAGPPAVSPDGRT
jgi:WhiB family transcriptional regulator, redox-sensing transcriptional regulator